MYTYLIKFGADKVDTIRWPVQINKGDILQLPGLDESLPEWVRNTKHWEVKSVIHISKPDSKEYYMTVLHVSHYSG